MISRAATSAGSSRKHVNKLPYLFHHQQQRKRRSRTNLRSPFFGGCAEEAEDGEIIRQSVVKGEPRETGQTAEKPGHAGGIPGQDGFVVPNPFYSSRWRTTASGALLVIKSSTVLDSMDFIVDLSSRFVLKLTKHADFALIKGNAGTYWKIKGRFAHFFLSTRQD